MESLEAPAASYRRGVSAQVLGRTSGAVLRRGNALTLLPNGDSTYADWLAAIARAKRWIHLENYIFQDDETGDRFVEALRERAVEGVHVRVLYDWYGSLDVLPTFWGRLRDAGIDVRAVNPPRLTDPFQLFRRDHRKLLAVDGEYASIGGVGIADAWLQRDPQTGLPYRDTCVAVRGPAVADIEEAFAGVWALNGGPLPTDERPAAEALPAAGDIPVRVVVQEPGKMRISRVLQVLGAGVEDRIWIADAYFLADPILREALIAAAQDGVDVRLLLPSTNDLPLVGAASRASYRPLLEAGARIWEYRGPMMHAKTTVADGWCSRIGSTNLNITGLLTNWEIDVLVEDAEFGRLMEKTFLADLEDASELALDGRTVRGGARRQRARSLARGSGPQRSTMVASVGSAVVQGAISDVLARHERNAEFGLGGVALLVALGLARFPRALAWPLAALLGAFGASRLVRALRRSTA